MRDNFTWTFDSELELKDAGAITASAAGTVGGSAAEIDLGTGRCTGSLVVDVTAMEVDTGDEIYTIALQGGDASGFGGDIFELATLVLGDSAVLVGTSDKTTGRYVVPFTNEINQVVWQYARIYCTIAGTIVTGINYSAFLTRPM